MAKDKATGLVLRPFSAEWTTVAGGGRGGLSAIDRGELDWTPADSTGLEEAGVDETADVADTTAPATLAECAAASGVTLKGGVHVAVESDQVLLRVVRLPSASPEELRGMVDLQVDKYSPFPVDSLAVGYEVLGEDEQGMLVLIGAVREGVVDGKKESMAAVGLHPVTVDAEAMGWWELISAVPRELPGGPEVHVLMTPSIQVIAAEGGIPLAFRSLALSAALEQDGLVASLAEEVDYTVMALELDHGPQGDATVVLWSAGNEAAAFAEALAEASGCQVLVQDLAQLPPASEGVARRAMASGRQLLDMTPASWRTAERNRRFKRQMLIAGGVSLVIWLLGVSAFAGAFLLKRNALVALQGDRDEWNRQAMEVREMRRRVFTLRKYTNQTHSALECLREVSSAQADGIELTSFSYRKGELVRVTGSGKAVGQVYEFKRRLDQSGLFVNPELESVRNDPRKRVELFDMIIPVPGEES